MAIRTERDFQPGRRIKTSNGYVYVMQFDGDNIVQMTKIWYAGLAMKELGWS